MRTNVSLLLILVTSILFSCQKERDFANRTSNGNGTNSSDELLVKIVEKKGGDSLVTTFGYNGDKKLISLRKTGINDQGDFVNTEYRFHRNGSGILTDFSTIDPDLIAQGIDSIITIVHYNSSTLRYTSYVINVSIPGFTLLDSSAFVYDGSGKIIGEDFYESPSGAGNDYYLSGKLNYAYSATGNITAVNIHDLDQSGTEIFTANTSNIQYDSKTNAIHMNNEGFVLGHPEWTSANNIISEQLSDSNGPVDDENVTINYTYNSASKPLTASFTIQPGNSISTAAYYYQ